MSRLALLVTMLALAGPVRGADLVFPHGEKEIRLRIEYADGERAPDAAWAEFLGRLFAHFDRDGDGALSEAEAQRVFALPLADNKVIAPDFSAMDADRDGKVTPTEFRAFYRAGEFTPLTVVVQVLPADALAPGAALFQNLDRNGDGKLSAAELKHAPAVLKRLDDDEDEVLTAKELLAAGDAPKLAPAGVKLAASVKTPPDAVLRLALGGKPSLAPATSAFKLAPDGGRLTVPGGSCVVTVSRDDPAAGFRAAKNFYLAQFKATAGNKPAAKALFEDDPTAQVLVGLFDAADRDGNGKLTLAELETFFDLVERGVSCRVVVTVSDRGRNLFDLFDADGNSSLDLGELLRAGRTLPDELARDGEVTRDAVPASYRLVAGRGPVGDSFGPVPFGAAAKPKPPAVAAARGPAWFRAMDKNGDGFVSAREFVGPPALFAKLDANGDGRISADEAAAVEP